MSDYPWLQEARKYVGLTEIPGPRHNSTIQRWLQKLGAWWNDDETPWCGVFVAHCVEAAGFKKTKNWYRAKAWASWGESCKPRVGAVAVFERKGGGHVGFMVGESFGDYAVLGGNQNNAVNVMAIKKTRLVACRWPSGFRGEVLKLPYNKAKPTGGNEA